MKLTCVTAVFNAIKSGNRENLIRCVESVAALKTEHEHLIYDGASTDGTAELLRELERTTPGLKVVSEPDVGIYNALNKGVRDAKGDWFYVLGCDDHICRPEVMDRLIWGCVSSDELIATEVYMKGCGSGNIRSIELNAILSYTPYCHQGVLMRTDLVRRCGGFDEKYKIAADYKMFLCCHMSGAAIRYRYGEDCMFACFGMNGTSESNTAEMCREFDLVVAEYFNLKLPCSAGSKPTLPVRTLLMLCVHSDVGVRASARNMLKVWARCNRYIRLAFLPLIVVTRPLRH